MLGKYHHAEVSLPGGCDIGSRPIDQHLKGFRALGATAVVRNGMIVVDSRQLTGAHIYFDMVSVGATIKCYVGGNDGKRKNSFRKCSKRAHVVDVANLLNTMGANIKGGWNGCDSN